MLATGRLAAAEEALYAAVSAKPRAPEPRGALGWYLASRARWRIAETLFDEAVRFGADPGAAERAKAAMAGYRRAAPAGPVIAVPFTPADDPHAIGRFPVRARRGGETAEALLDLTVVGVVLGVDAARALPLRGSRGAERLEELWVAELRFTDLAVRVEPTLRPTDIRIGLDVLWPSHPLVDSHAGTMTLGRAPEVASLRGRVEQIPFVLAFPGMLVVPRVGSAPLRLESAPARALLRGTRWQIDAAQATLVVER